MKLISTIALIILWNSHSYAQDTLLLERKPEVILKSWYPEFKEFPNLKVGENKILYTIIPDFENQSVRNNDINLIVLDSLVKIKETEKLNQFLITVNPTHLTYTEFEIWFDIGNSTILIEENTQWTDIKKIYPCSGNRVMLQKVKLKIDQ